MEDPFIGAARYINTEVGPWRIHLKEQRDTSTPREDHGGYFIGAARHRNPEAGPRRYIYMNSKRFSINPEVGPKRIHYRSSQTYQPSINPQVGPSRIHVHIVQYGSCQTSQPRGMEDTFTGAVKHFISFSL
jgi:hypothetical protein